MGQKLEPEWNQALKGTVCIKGIIIILMCKRFVVISLTALDVALKNGHTGCADYLIFCHAPSGGGVHHRAAATIQAVWKYHRYKVI